MSTRFVLFMFIALLAVGVSAFAMAHNEKADTGNGGHYDIKMLGLTAICIVDYESNIAHLYKESKDDNRLELFKSIDLSKAGSETIEYLERPNRPENQ